MPTTFLVPGNYLDSSDKVDCLVLISAISLFIKAKLVFKNEAYYIYWILFPKPP